MRRLPVLSCPVSPKSFLSFLYNFNSFFYLSNPYLALFRSVYLCLPLLIYFLQGCLFLTPLCYLIIAYIGSYQVLSLITEYDCLIVWVYMYKNLRIFNIFVINVRPYLGIYIFPINCTGWNCDFTR